MSEFLKSEVLIILLAVYGLFYTEYPYYLLCAAGILMVVLNIESLSDERKVGLVVLKLLLMVICCCISSGYLLFMLFEMTDYKQYAPRRKSLECEVNVVLPPILFMLYQLIVNRDIIASTLPMIIVKLCVLTCVSVLLWYFENIMQKYIDYKHNISLAMTKLAVNELAEHKLNRELIIKNNIIERNTRLEERENISRNIHNSVGHSITAAIMALDAAEVLWESDSKRAIDKVRTANERIHMSLDSIRRAVRILDEETVNVSIEDFRMELSEIMDNFMMDTDIKISFDINVTDYDLMIPREYTEFLTGAVEELLTNGVKHGNADKFTVGITADSSHLKITVLDNGHSDFCDENSYYRIQNGFGIKKIIKYVEQNGGTSLFKNENGFRAEITLEMINL